MTCIVGIVDKENGVTYIGGDSLGSSSSFKCVRNDRKVFKVKGSNNSCIGFTTSYRMGNLLTYCGNLIPENEILNHETMVVNFVPRIIKLFGSHGFQENKSGELSGGTFLVAQDDRLFKIQSDYQVEEHIENYNACGCGSIAALGSLHSTSKLNLSPIERIRLSLQAATAFIPGVEPPFYIINTKNDDVIEFLN